jgi:hypothetical protein
MHNAWTTLQPQQSAASEWAQSLPLSGASHFAYADQCGSGTAAHTLQRDRSGLRSLLLAPRDDVAQPASKVWPHTRTGCRTAAGALAVRNAAPKLSLQAAASHAHEPLWAAATQSAVSQAAH